MGLLGNFLGNALGMQSAEEYTQSVEAASRLRDLQNRNQSLKDEAKVPVTNVDTDQVGGLKIPDTLDLGPLTQPPLKNIPKPPVDQEGGVADGVPIDDPDLFYEDKILRDFRRGQGTDTSSPPSVPEFDSGQTVINPNDNQNIPNNQIPVPEFKGADLSKLFPKGVVSENDVSDEEKQSLHVQGFPWKVIDKNGGKVVVHNGVEYDIKEVGDGSFILTNRMGMPNYPLTDAFTKARIRGITDTEIKPRTNSYEDDLAAATVDNDFIANALKSVKDNKFRNGITSSTVGFARQFGVDEGEALGLLAVESNFGNVKFDNRSSTRGPLQIQNLAYKDVKAFYKGPKPDGVTDAQWSAMTAAVAKMPKNHANLTDTNDQIAAGLLYYKMIELKGVDKRFQAAAYYDGYGKYIGINDISDVKNFSGPNTLASVTKYNSAVLGLKQYMNQLSDYYYGDGTAVPTNVSANQTATNQTATNQTATNQTATTSASGFEIRQEDGAVVYKDGQPVFRFTGADGQALAEQYIAEQTGQKTTKEVTDATETADKAVNQDDDVSIEMFVNNPSSIPITTQRILDERKLVTDNIKTQIDEVNRAIAIQNQRADEFTRLAAIARRNRQRDVANNYLEQAAAARQNAEDLRESGIVLVQQGKEAVFKYDNTLLLAQGAQALQDLSYGSTARAGAVLSAYSGYKIEIVPRSDGKYDMVVEGNVQATYTKQQLADRLQSAFDGEYRKSKQARAAKRADQVFEKNLDTAAEIKKIEAQLVSTLATEAAKAAYAQELERIKNSKGQVYSLGDGKAIIKTADGRYIFMDPAGQVPVPGKKDEFTRGLVKKLLTTDEANAIISGVDATQGGDPYKTN